MGAAIPIRWLRPSRRLPQPAELRSFDPTDFAPSLRTRLLVLQPTPFCNIDCDYCYLPNRQDTSRMSLDVVRLAAKRLADDGLAGSTLTVVWHAGEPLVVPPSYYEKAFAVVADAIGQECRISHSFQTNGTLINDEWCDLFARHAVRVGVSVDGPADIHDRHRRTRRGKGTHSKVLAGMNRLRDHGIPFHAIAVITKDSIARARDLYEFFLAAEVQEVGMNFDEVEGQHTTSSLAHHEDEHRAFLTETLALSTEAGGRYRVRELANAMRLIAGDPATYTYKGRTWPENGQTVPFAIVSVACNGNFSTFSPELVGQKNAQYADFVLGNVMTEGYFEAARGDAFVRLWDDLQRGIAACEASCAYFKYCGGGAPANKLYENGGLDTAETLYCRSMIKRPFDVVLGALESRSAGHEILDRASCE